MPKLLYVQNGNAIAEVPYIKGVHEWAKSNKVKNNAAEAIFKELLSGKDIVFTDDAHKALCESGAHFLQESDKLKEKLNEQLQEEEDKKNEQGKLVVAAISRGYALSKAYQNSAVSSLEQLLGNKFHVTATSLSLVKGEKLDEVEAAQALATLAEVSERNQVVETTTMFALGDLIKTIRKATGDEIADRIVHQAVSVIGRSKHTIQEAERMVEWCDKYFKDGERPQNLTPTHFSELRQGSQDREGKPTIPPAALKKIIHKVVEGNVVGTGVEGEDVVEQRKPLSCAETRKLLDEAKGKKKEKPEATEATVETPPSEAPETSAGLVGFLYIKDTQNIFHSETLDKAALEATEEDGTEVFSIVINLGDMVIVDRDGKNSYPIRLLPQSEPKEVVAVEAPASDLP